MDRHSKLLADEQNGFREGRSTVDQLFTLTKMIDVRKRNYVILTFVFLSISKRHIVPLIGILITLGAADNVFFML